MTTKRNDREKIPLMLLLFKKERIKTDVYIFFCYNLEIVCMVYHIVCIKMISFRFYYFKKLSTPPKKKRKDFNAFDRAIREKGNDKV